MNEAKCPDGNLLEASNRHEHRDKLGCLNESVFISPDLNLIENLHHLKNHVHGCFSSNSSNWLSVSYFAKTNR